MDAVVHLAAIVGDTACMAAETSTVIKTNFVSGAELAKLCKSNGIGKFIFASTCSVYGINNKILDENSETNPISLYAQTKLGAENEILKETNRMATILRFATVYGLSPRMRFDLVINYLTLKAMKEKECFILGGNQWRCFVHTVDIAEAIKLVLEAKNERVAGQVFNVSSDNYQIKDIGKLIEKCIPDCNVEYKTDVEDKRTYMVSAEKIKGLGFEPKVTVEKGILEMKSALEKGQFKNPNDSKYYNYK